jgi:hypothetical protein
MIFRRTELATALLVIMPLAALVPKYLLIVHTLGGGSEVFDTGFGFGGYVRGLFDDGSFHSCAATPFAGCDPGLCVYATRMPFLPLLYAGLAKLVGTKSIAIAIAKCTLTAAVLATFLFLLARDVRFSVAAVVLAYALYFGPQALKHGASLEYEEGILIDLEGCLAIAALYLVKPTLSAAYGKRAFMGLAAVLLATVLYFTKTTALLTLLVVLALLLRDRELEWRLKVVTLLCVLAPFAAWTAHNYSSSAAVHLSSSWNGENLYRGSSQEGFELYPQVQLDRLFDSTHATLADGRRVELHNLRHQRCFVDEWAWNDFYSDLARSWSQQHPMDALRFTGRRVWVSLFELRHTPYREAVEGPSTEYSPVISAAMVIWMGFARLLFLVLLGLLARDLWRGEVQRALWTLALIGAGWVPYMLVFVYQRHVVPLLLMAGFMLLGLTARPVISRTPSSQPTTAPPHPTAV